MAHRVLTASARWWARIPPVAQIAAIYLVARVVTTLFLMLAAGMSGPLSRFGADASVGSFVLGWDAQWYWLIAVDGYPSNLTFTQSGVVEQNAWAFLPVFPYVAKAVGFLLGSWGAGAFLVSLVCGYLSCLVLFRMLRERIGRSAALWAVIFFAFGPLAALFQVGYAESLFLLLLLLALDAVIRRRYALVYPLVIVLAFTRPGVLAFALYLGLHGIWRWWRRRDDPLPGREIVHILALGLLSTAAGFAWPVIAGIATGYPDAYVATELSWRIAWLPSSGTQFIPFAGFVQAAQFWFQYWGIQGWVGIVALVVLIVVAAMALFLPAVRRLGTDLRLWSASYLLYVLAVFFPQSSTFRLLLPVAPLAGAVAVPRSRAYRGIVLALCLLGQWVWIVNVYAIANLFWQVP